MLFSISVNILAQQKLNPVHWSVQVKEVDATTYDILFTADLDTDWELYSQFQERDDGPLPTTFIFQKNEGYTKIGTVKESWKNKKKVYDEMFDMTVVKYEKSALFTQRIKVTTPKKVLVMIEYMSCRSTSCLPPRYVELNIDLSKRSVQKPFNQID